MCNSNSSLHLAITCQQWIECDIMLSVTGSWLLAPVTSGILGTARLIAPSALELCWNPSAASRLTGMWQRAGPFTISKLSRAEEPSPDPTWQPCQVNMAINSMASSEPWSAGRPWFPASPSHQQTSDRELKTLDPWEPNRFKSKRSKAPYP